jgi:peptidoglycan/LPS O-acetylase OafA/YrhL
MTPVKQRLDALTTLRFFAAALIVIGHSDTIFGPFAAARAAPFNQGVSFFFVLSGFILTWNYPVLNDWQQRRHFLLARFARIWPLHFVTCVLWIAIIFNFDRAAYFPGTEGLLKLLANLLLVQAWVPDHNWALSFNGVSWSISTELFFYLMFPLLIALWKKRWHQIFLIQASIIFLIVSIATFYAIPGESADGKLALPLLLYFTPVVRIFEFTVGIALAFIVRRMMDSNIALTRPQWLIIEVATFAVITVSMLAAANFAGIQQTLGNAANYHFSASGLWLFWSLVIGVFALSRGPIKDILSLRFAVFLGEISFSLYLCHALVINYLENYREQVQPFGMYGYTVFWAGCLLFASLLFMGVETPFRKLILLIASKKKSAKQGFAALYQCFGLKETLSIAALACMTLAMIFLRPSTIARIDDAQAKQFMQSSAELMKLPDGVTFNKKYQVLGVKIELAGKDKSKDTAEVLVLMRVNETLHATDTLALHTIGADGQNTGGFDMRLDTGRLDISAGTQWIQKFKVPKAKLDHSVQLGVAMYTTPVKLFDAVGGNRDWGGTRLILPIQR